MVHTFYDNDGLIVPISHAGDTSHGHPPGSLGAYLSAYELGFRYFQIDVVAVGGGELASAHAIFGRRRSWEDRSVAELQAQGEQVDRVEDILASIPDGRWNIELKSRRAEAAVVALLRAQHQRYRRFGVSAPFNRRILKRLRAEFGDEICTNGSLLEGSLLGIPLIPMKKQHADAMQVFFAFARLRSVVYRNSRSEIQFQVWPVNQRSQMERLIDLGVRGIITDNHRLLRSVLEERNQWPVG